MSFRHILGDVLRDLRYGARAFTRNPLFSMVAVTSLVLGRGYRQAAMASEIRERHDARVWVVARQRTCIKRGSV
jgi:hypothetical protein